MKHRFTLNDWENGNVPENAPPDSLLASLPHPVKYRTYAPAWGKGGKSAEKAVATRNRGIYEKNRKTFGTFVDSLVPILDARSLFDAGADLRRTDLLALSGYRYFVLGDKGAWLAPDDQRTQQALDMGAVPVSPDEFYTRHPEAFATCSH